MQTVTMSEIQRQKDPELRRAVELAAAAKPEESLSHLRDVRQVPNDEERRRAVAAEFAQLHRSGSEPDHHRDGHERGAARINQGVREKLGLAGRGKEYATLTRVDTTQEERRYSRNYEVGTVIQPEREYPSLQPREGRALHRHGYRPWQPAHGARRERSQRHLLPEARSEALGLQHRRSAELAPGDRVRVTRNDAQRDLANGDRFRVLKTTAEAVYLTDERRVISVPADRPLHLEHAYATTVHSAQGVTADRVISRRVHEIADDRGRRVLRRHQPSAT